MLDVLPEKETKALLAQLTTASSQARETLAQTQQTMIGIEAAAVEARNLIADVRRLLAKWAPK